VPVSWLAPSVPALTWASGTDVLVVGRVRRRFFRAGGVTQSRTEVVASAVVPLRRTAAVRRALRGAVSALEQVAS
jgi:single-strand DNA-binding protein